MGNNNGLRSFGQDHQLGHCQIVEPETEAPRLVDDPRVVLPFDLPAFHASFSWYSLVLFSSLSTSRSISASS